MAAVGRGRRRYPWADEARRELQQAVTDWCAGRESFKSSSSAWTAAYKRRRAGDHVEPYRCPICQKFHVGPVVPGAERRRVWQAIQTLFRQIPAPERRSIRGLPPLPEREPTSAQLAWRERSVKPARSTAVDERPDDD